jgi:hypothetical protein
MGPVIVKSVNGIARPVALRAGSPRIEEVEQSQPVR